MNFGLDTKTIHKIREVFSKHKQIEKAILYGSRAKGNYKKGSDIDLVLKGEELNLTIINKISMELDDLLLPYSFDISILNQISNPELLAHIKGVGVVFYDKDAQ